MTGELAPVWTFLDGLASIVSPVRLLSAIALAIGGYLLTRVAVRLLAKTLSRIPTIEAGLASSLTIITGYFGYVLTGFSALGLLGIDLTSLSIIAGALSVGVGFGLQSIVSNFVSGLILLIERPIKIGDWVSVGATEGKVLRIGIRATEIEDSGLASVLIPNNELITGRVRNQTLRSPDSAIRIPLELPPKVDPAPVRLELVALATAHPLVATASTTIDGISARGTDITLYVAVRDFRSGGQVGSDLRTSILSMLDRLGIQWREPPQDLIARGIADLKATVTDGKKSTKV